MTGTVFTLGLFRGVPERYRYEIQALIREFLPFASFREDPEDNEMEIYPDLVRLRDGDRILQQIPCEPIPYGHDLLKNQIKACVYDLMEEKTGHGLPWGILTGVRPTKIVYEQLLKGEDPEIIRTNLTVKYRLDPDKAGLVTQTACREKKLLSSHTGRDLSIYIGIPFCPTRCDYCSFVSYDYSQYRNLADQYIGAVIREITDVIPLMEKYRLSSFYMGGGTPSVLSAGQMDRLLHAVEQLFGTQAFAEKTVECGRPDTITEEKLKVLMDHGIGRISINPQTFEEKTLKKIGRQHTTEDLFKAYDCARACGMKIVNMDLILGLPGEDADDVRRTFEAISDLRPENLTVHTLAVKRSSRLNQQETPIDLQAVHDTVQEMIDISRRTACKLEMQPYYMYRQKNMAGNFENVGYALPGTECLYNMEIMEERQSILAFGAGAVSKIYYPDENRLERVANVKNVTEYLNRTDEMTERKRRQMLA